MEQLLKLKDLSFSELFKLKKHFKNLRRELYSGEFLREGNQSRKLAYDEYILTLDVAIEIKFKTFDLDLNE